MQVAKKDSCEICHKKAGANRKLTNCKRCKRTVCPDCSKEKIVTYTRTGGKATQTSMNGCDNCRLETSSLRKFKETHKLKFCTESKLGLRLLRAMSAASAEQVAEEYREAHRNIKAREKEEVYQRTKTAIVEDKLYSRLQLGQALFDLGSLVSADVREEEQNEKLKYLLLAVLIGKPPECLKSLSYLVQFLVLLLTEHQVYHFVKVLCSDFIPECFMLRKQEQAQALAQAFRGQFQAEKLVLPYCENFSEFYAQCWRSLSANRVSPELTAALLQHTVQDRENAVDNFNRGLAAIIKAGMKASSADEDLAIQIQSADPSALKGLLTLSSKQKSPEKLREKDEKLSYAELMAENQALREENTRLKSHEEQVLLEIRQKYLLIVDTLRSDEELARQHYLKQEAKLQHEKSELIDKIVRLGEDIDKLKECEKYYLQEISTLQSKLSSAIKNKGDEEYESVSPSSMAGEKKRLLLGLIEALNTGFHPPIKILTMEEVDQLEKDWIDHLKGKLEKQKDQYELKRRASKDKLECETTRLLGVLARKEERFVLEICEKDRIIECYEDVLWHLENRIQLQSKNDIAKRVNNIIAMRKQPIKHHKEKEDCLLF